MSAARPIQVGSVEPRIDPDSAEWWEALAEKRLLLPRCRPNGHAYFPPGPSCPYCGSVEREMREASGRGRVYSWVVTHRAFDRAFANDVPYTVVFVDLEEGPRILGRLRHEPTHDLRAGAPVRAIFYEVAGRTLLGFELEGDDPGAPRPQTQAVVGRSEGGDEERAVQPGCRVRSLPRRSARSRDVVLVFASIMLVRLIRAIPPSSSRARRRASSR